MEGSKLQNLGCPEEGNEKEGKGVLIELLVRREPLENE